MLSRKEFFVKFRRTSGGILWSVALPIVQAGLMAAVFSQVVRFDTPIGYAVFIYAGTLPFNFLSNGVNLGVGAVVDGSGLSTKIYFPRLVLPLVVVGAGFYSLVPGIVVLLGLGALFDGNLGIHTLWLFPAVALLTMLTASAAAVLSVVQVYVRDLRYVVVALFNHGFTSHRWCIRSPRSDGSEVGSRRLVGVIETFRAAVGAADPGWGTAVAWTVGWTVGLAVGAVLLFRRHDRVVVDLL